MNYELIIRREETFKGYLTRPPVCYNITVSSQKPLAPWSIFFIFLSLMSIDFLFWNCASIYLYLRGLLYNRPLSLLSNVLSYKLVSQSVTSNFSMDPSSGLLDFVFHQRTTSANLSLRIARKSLQKILPLKQWSCWAYFFLI